MNSTIIKKGGKKKKENKTKISLILQIIIIHSNINYQS